MALLKGISINNFRIFKEDTTFDFAPITVLTGPNSSGKSSLFKALLLLADSAKKYGLSELDFTGESHNLGNFEDVLPYGHTEESISFALEFGGLADELFGMLDEGFTLALIYDKGQLKEFSIFINKWMDQAGALQEKLIYHSRIKERQGEAISKLHYFNFEQAVLHFQQYIKIQKNLSEEEVKCKRINSILNEGLLFEKLSSFDQENIKNFILDLGNSFTFFHITDTNPILPSIVDSCINENHYVHLIKKDGEYDVVPQKVRDIMNESYIEKYVDYFNIIGDLDYNELFHPVFFNFSSVLFNKIEKLNKNISKTISHDLANLTYTEAVRANSRRLYSYQSQGTSVNQLLLNFRKKMDRTNRLSIYFMTNFLEKWIKEFKIGDGLEIKNISGAAHEISIIRNGKHINLADLGYGYTQFLSIPLKMITEANLNGYLSRKDRQILNSKNWQFYNAPKTVLTMYYHKTDQEIPQWLLEHIEKSPPDFAEVIKLLFFQGTILEITELAGKYHFPDINGPLFLLEEPETNLHPKLQSILADFFVDACRMFEMTLIAETHSEYLVRKLQYLVAKGEIRPEDVAIYYFYPPDEVPEGHKQVERINIKADGRLDNEFGTGFFDESAKLMMSLLTGNTLN